MKSNLKLVVLGIIFIYLKSFPVLAQNKLNEAEIEHFINSLPQIYQLLMQSDSNSQALPNAKYDTEQSNIEESFMPMTDMLNNAKLQPSFTQFKLIVHNGGFSSPDNWAKTGDDIMNAHAAYYRKRNYPDTSQLIIDLEQKLSDIKSNQFISSEQKNVLINKLEKSIELINDPNYNGEEYISMISPYIERLNSLFEEFQ